MNGDWRACRDVLFSDFWSTSAPSCATLTASKRLTNERRYESKDSLEMEKGSMSPMLLRVSIELRDGAAAGRLGHKLFSSLGEG